MYVAWAVLLAFSFALEACAIKYLDSFTTSPGPLEREITVAWNSSNFSLPDSNEITLVLHNISGAWKRYTVPYSQKQLNVSGLTVNKEYWFVGNYSVNGLQYAQESAKMWGQSLPSAPTALNSSYVDGKVTLMYSKPARDGGSDLRYYLLKVNSTDAQGRNSVNILMLHSSSTTYEATLPNGNYAVYEIAAGNNMGNSSFVAFPKSRNSVVRFVINGTTTNPLVYPSGVEDRIQTFINKKLTDRQSSRRRRMLQNSGANRYVKVEGESLPTFFGSTNKSFTHYLRVGRLSESELDFVSTQLSSTEFLNDVKDLDGFDSSSSFWDIPVSNIVAVQIPTSSSKPLLPKLIFDGYLDSKAVLKWSYDTISDSNPNKKFIIGGGSQVDRYRLTWHSAPEDKRLIYGTKVVKDKHLGTPCSPPFSLYPCNGTHSNKNATTLLDQDLNSTVRSIAVNDLVNGMAYRFSLSITNKLGNTVEMASSTYVPVGPIGNFKIESVEAVDQGINVTYSIEANFGNGRPIDYIKIEGLQQENNDCGTPNKVRGLENIVIRDASINKALLSGLQPKKRYYVRMTVHLFYEDNTTVNTKLKTSERPKCTNIATPTNGIYITGRPVMSNYINVSYIAGADSLAYNGNYAINVRWRHADDSGDKVTNYKITAIPDETKTKLLPTVGLKGGAYYRHLQPSYLLNDFETIVRGKYISQKVSTLAPSPSRMASNSTNITSNTNSSNATGVGASTTLKFVLENNVTIRGLHPGIAYTIRVFGNNSNGYGLPGVSSTVVFKGAQPFYPVNPTAHFHGNNAVRITWDPPFHNGENTTAYNYELARHQPKDRELNANAPCNANTTESWNVIPGSIILGEVNTSRIVTTLNNGDCYRFRIWARNKHGYGPKSNWSNIEVPAGRPYKVKNVIAVGGDRQIKLYWDAPFSNGRKISSYVIVMTKAHVLFPEGLDNQDGDSIFVLPPTVTYNLIQESINTQKREHRIEYVWGYPKHVVDNGDAYYFTISAVNEVGRGAEGTHDNGTDASLVKPIWKPQLYATIQWKQLINNSFGLSAPVLGDKDIVYMCSNKENKVGVINAYKRFTGELLWNFESPQMDLFTLGDTNPCPAVVSDGRLIVVSNTMSPKNTHLYMLETKLTGTLYSLEDFQDDDLNWIDMNSTNTVDIEYSFSRDHSIQVFRPWVDDLYTTRQERGKVEPRNDFEVSTYLPPLRTSPAISASHNVMFAASTDNYVYAYDIRDKDSPNGTILRFPYEMCDIRDRLAFGTTMASTNFSMVPCGCPAYAHLPAKPLLAAPVLIEDSMRAILLVATFDVASSSTLSAVDVRDMILNKNLYKYDPTICHVPNAYTPPANQNVKKIWTFSTASGQPLTHSPVWFENTVLVREGMYLVALNTSNGQRLWTFSVNCRNSGGSLNMFKGAPFVEVEYDPNCDYVDIMFRTF